MSKRKFNKKARKNWKETEKTYKSNWNYRSMADKFKPKLNVEWFGRKH